MTRPAERRSSICRSVTARSWEARTVRRASSWLDMEGGASKRVRVVVVLVKGDCFVDGRGIGLKSEEKSMDGAMIVRWDWP